MEDWIELFEIQDYRHTQDKSLQEDTIDGRRVWARKIHVATSPAIEQRARAFLTDLEGVNSV